MRTTTTPPTKRRVGRPAGHIKRAADGSFRWSLHGAAREFNVHRETLARRQRVLDIKPGKDGYFSTKDIIAMIHSDKEAQTIGLIAEQRKMLERENREAEAELVPTATVVALTPLFCRAVRRVILATSMTSEEKTAALDEMAQLEAIDWTAEAKAHTRKKR